VLLFACVVSKSLYSGIVAEFAILAF